MALEHGPDHALAANHARQAIAKADALGDDSGGAVGRYELAMCTLFGGEGPVFAAARVVDLVKGARARVGRLGQWGLAGLVGSACAGDQMAEEFVTNVAAAVSLPSSPSSPPPRAACLLLLPLLLPRLVLLLLDQPIGTLICHGFTIMW